MKRLTLLRLNLLCVLILVVLAGCVSTITVSGATAKLRPPDPVLTCLTPTLTLAPGAQGTLHWEATVPAPTTVAVGATATWKNPDGSTGTYSAAPTTVTVAEATVTAVAFAWAVPSNVTFVSGSVTDAAGAVTAIAAPTAGLVNATCGTLAAGQKATVAVVVKAK